ncbi:zinc finger CCCH domain-containing protein 18-like [Haplochromis burtoni]|uniref:zinc finger CCCH domain-containing protein 18-like n=1 Tax=Haplochromis burtoni TaxID=8153 RepID=UPI001C2D9E08|nr:zinc finger CCCH domain-containing protein 18-like [Haplochromis burtoni]
MPPIFEWIHMDTPESPTQSPQSPEEEEKGLSDSELLESPNEEEDRVISDSEILNEEGDIEVLESHGKHVELEEEEDEVVPDFVSEPEDEEPFGEMGELVLIKYNQTFERLSRLGAVFPAR